MQKKHLRRIPPPSSRNPELILIERQIRQAIRDAVNHNTRKPFYWGGLSGYEQLEAIGQGLQQIQDTDRESDYLRLLRMKVENALEKNHSLAEDVKVTHQKLRQVAQCLHYPSRQNLPIQSQMKVSSAQVTQEIDAMMSARKIEIFYKP